jgi:hypothetical protein
MYDGCVKLRLWRWTWLCVLRRVLFRGEIGEALGVLQPISNQPTRSRHFAICLALSRAPPPRCSALLGCAMYFVFFALLPLGFLPLRVALRLLVGFSSFRLAVLFASRALLAPRAPASLSRPSLLGFGHSLPFSCVFRSGGSACSPAPGGFPRVLPLVLRCSPSPIAHLSTETTPVGRMLCAYGDRRTFLVTFGTYCILYHWARETNDPTTTQLPFSAPAQSSRAQNLPAEAFWLQLTAVLLIALVESFTPLCLRSLNSK